MFSFGIIVFEMVSGVNPFEGSTVTETLAKRLVDFEPPSLGAAVMNCPRELDWIVSTCLRKNPLQRFNTTRELAAALTGLRDLLSGARVPTPLPGPSPVPADHGDPMWWWKMHIGIICAVYAAVIFPAWHVHGWMAPTIGMVLFLMTVAGAAIAISLRLHLWFTHEVDVAELLTLHEQTRPWIVAADCLFSVSISGIAFAIAAEHETYTVLLFAVAVVTLVASLVIEPTTTRSAFRRCERISAVRQAQQS
jgi:uncharacterized membrane protein YeaQ/YmgE (transglycosylase-associated protein family)